MYWFACFHPAIALLHFYRTEYLQADRSLIVFSTVILLLQNELTPQSYVALYCLHRLVAEKIYEKKTFHFHVKRMSQVYMNVKIRNCP